MSDIRDYINRIRDYHKKTILLESIDDTTKNVIIKMFKDGVDETTNVEAISLSDGVFKSSGIISLEIRYEITVSNNDNETICNIWFPNNVIELTNSSSTQIVNLFNFFNGTLVEYVRQNLI